MIAEFEFGADMDEIESTLSRGLAGLSLPQGVQEPRLLRITPNTFPILQLSVVSDRPLSELQELTESTIAPEIRSVPGVFSVQVTGGSEQQVLVAAIPEKLAETGISIPQVAGSCGRPTFPYPRAQSPPTAPRCRYAQHTGSSRLTRSQTSSSA